MTGIDRRALLAGLASLAGLAAAQPLRAGAPVGDRVSYDPFVLGVASGEPSRDGVVLWTRLTDETGSMLDRAAVRVMWEVAEDDSFKTIRQSGEVVTGPGIAHSVHIELSGLSPGKVYHYRFSALGVVSPIGRAITLPFESDHLRLALTSCQHFEQGYFTGYRDIVAQKPDLVVQVGDYIYEHYFGSAPRVRNIPITEPTDLHDYRRLHAIYKTDKDLQAAHRALTWLFTWDDHEVSNDYAGLANNLDLDPATFFKRRTAAYRAYFEHMPIRPSRWGSAANPRLYHSANWGKLASIQVLDGRSRRSPHPCSGPGRRGGRSISECATLHDVEHTMLGGEQEVWLYDTLARETCMWTLLAQQTLFAPMVRVPNGVPEIWTDCWDGYPQARERLESALRQPSVKNPIILSGDIHCFFVNDVFPDGDPSRAYATEFLTSCLASRTQGDAPFGDLLPRNPHIRYKDTKNSGYILIDVRPDALLAELRIVEDQRDINGTVTTGPRFMVRAGQAGAHRI